MNLNLKRRQSDKTPPHHSTTIKSTNSSTIKKHIKRGRGSNGSIQLLHDTFHNTNDYNHSGSPFTSNTMTHDRATPVSRNDSADISMLYTLPEDSILDNANPVTYTHNHDDDAWWREIEQDAERLSSVQSSSSNPTSSAKTPFTARKHKNHATLRPFPNHINYDDDDNDKFSVGLDILHTPDDNGLMLNSSPTTTLQSLSPLSTSTSIFNSSFHQGKKHSLSSMKYPTPNQSISTNTPYHKAAATAKEYYSSSKQSFLRNISTPQQQQMMQQQYKQQQQQALPDSSTQNPSNDETALPSIDDLEHILSSNGEDALEDVLRSIWQDINDIFPTDDLSQDNLNEDDDDENANHIFNNSSFEDYFENKYFTNNRTTTTGYPNSSPHHEIKYLRASLKSALVALQSVREERKDIEKNLDLVVDELHEKNTILNQLSNKDTTHMSRVNEVEKENDVLRNKIQVLEEEKNVMICDLEQLQHDSDNEHQKLIDMERQFQSKCEENDILSSEMEGYQNQIHSFEIQVEKYHNLVKDLERDLNSNQSSKTKSKELEQNLVDMRKQLSTLESMNEQSSNEVNRINNTCESLHRENAKYQHDIKCKDDVICQLKAEKDELKVTNQNMIQNLQENEATVNHLRIELEQTSTKVSNYDEISDRLKDMESHLQRREKVVQEHHRINHSLEAEVKRLTLESQSLVLEVQTLQKELDEARQESAMNEENKAHESSLLENLENKLNSLENNLQDERDKVKMNLNKIKELESMVSDKNLQLSDKSNVITSLHEEIKILITKLCDFDDISQKLDESETVRDRLEEDLRDKLNEIQQLQSQLNSISVQPESYNKEVSKLKNSMNEIEEHNHNQEKELSMLQNELTKVKEQLKNELEASELKSIKMGHLETELSCKSHELSDQILKTKNLENEHDLLLNQCSDHDKILRQYEELRLDYERCENDLKNQVESKLLLENELQSQLTEIERLRNALASHDDLNEIHSKAMQELESTKEKVTDLVIKLQENKHLLDTRSEQINELESSLLSKDVEISQIKEKMNRLQSDFGKVSKQNEHLESHGKRRERDMQDQLMSIQTLNEQVKMKKQLEMQLETCKSALQLKDIEICKLQNEVSLNSQRQTHHEQLEEDLQLMKNILLGLETEIVSEKDKVQTKSKEIELLESTLLVKDKELTDSTAQVEKLQLEVENLSKMLSEVEADLIANQRDMQDQLMSIQTLNEQVKMKEQLEMQLETCKSALQLKDIEICKLQQNKVPIENQQQTHHQQLEEDLQLMKNILLGLETEIVSEKNNVQTKSKEIELLESTLLVKEKELTDSTAQVEKLQLEVENLSKKLSEVEADLIANQQDLKNQNEILNFSQAQKSDSSSQINNDELISKMEMNKVVHELIDELENVSIRKRKVTDISNDIGENVDGIQEDSRNTQESKVSPVEFSSNQKEESKFDGKVAYISAFEVKKVVSELMSLLESTGDKAYLEHELSDIMLRKVCLENESELVSDSIRNLICNIISQRRGENNKSINEQELKSYDAMNLVRILAMQLRVPVCVDHNQSFDKSFDAGMPPSQSDIDLAHNSFKGISDEDGEYDEWLLRGDNRSFVSSINQMINHSTNLMNTALEDFQRDSFMPSEYYEETNNNNKLVSVDFEAYEKLRQRCDLLESEREDFLNETLDLMEASRAANTAEIEAIVARIEKEADLRVAKCEKEAMQQLLWMTKNCTCRPIE